jgi:hypothetical protein
MISEKGEVQTKKKRTFVLQSYVNVMQNENREKVASQPCCPAACSFMQRGHK